MRELLISVPADNILVVTHQVNITSITGLVPAQGEAVVLRAVDGQPVVLGRLQFENLLQSGGPATTQSP
jgi:hypothetical protein